MSLKELPLIFNRALEHTFDRSKWFFTFVVLAVCGVFVVFCRGLATHANPWIAMSLTFLPFFFCSGILLALGVVLIRSYHDQIKKKPVNYLEILSRSWEIALGAAYFTVPIILLYLILWILLGLFLLLRSIPGLGDFFSVILAFAPFIINAATLFLAGCVIGLLFFVSPVIALKGLSRTLISQVLVRRFTGDLYRNLALFKIAMLPLVFYVGFLLLSLFMTGSLCAGCDDPVHSTLEGFFIMVPFTALLAPAVIFFFNFAAEAHVLTQKNRVEG